MKSLIGSDEAKLVLALMSKKKEVPEDLKAKALEQLRVFSMACEKGSAKGYLLDNLINAIEADDVDRVKEIGLLSYACLDDTNDLEETSVEDVSINPETEEAAKAAIDAFVEDMKRKDVPNGAIEAMIKKVISNFAFIPFMYQDEILAGFSAKHNCVLVFGIGFEGDRIELAEKFMKIDERADAMRLMAEEFEFEGETDIHFCSIRYKLLSDRDMELVIRGLE